MSEFTVFTRTLFSSTSWGERSKTREAHGGVSRNNRARFQQQLLGQPQARGGCRSHLLELQAEGKGEGVRLSPHLLWAPLSSLGTKLGFEG